MHRKSQVFSRLWRGLLLGPLVLSGQVRAQAHVPAQTPAAPPEHSSAQAQLPTQPVGAQSGLTLVFGEKDVVAEVLSSVPAAGNGPWVVDPEPVLRARREGVAVSALADLAQVDGLLAEARRRVADLDESGALRLLARAQGLAQASLAVPGAAAYLAEVELQLAMTAAQAGLAGLAEASLERAARLDPRRQLLAGEASPAVVQLSARIHALARAAPEGDLGVSADAQGARVFLDDVEQGMAPLRVRASVGTHALRIEAPGRLPYGTLLVVHEGRRPMQHFVLAADPAYGALSALGVAATRGASAQIPTALAQLQAHDPGFARVWLVERAARSDRTLVIACDVNECAPRFTLLGTQLHALASDATGASGEQVSAARAWLRADSAPTSTQDVREAAWWKRWYVWSGVALLAASAATLLAISLAPQPERELHVIIDHGELR